MKIKKRLVIMIITAVLLITYAVGHILKFDFGLIYLPKSYVLFCMEDTLLDGWKEVKNLYNTPLSLTVTASDEEKKVFSLTAYNDKNKIVLSSSDLFGEPIGLAKNKSINNKIDNGNSGNYVEKNSSQEKNTDKTGRKSQAEVRNKKDQIRSLIEIYNKYAKVSKSGQKSFAVTGGKDNMCETDEYEVVLDKNIIEILPDYLKNYIADEKVLNNIDSSLTRLDSDIILHIYVDDSHKIRSANISFNYETQKVYMEVIFNNAVKVWDDLTITCIFGKNADRTVSIKSKGDHSLSGELFTDETNILILSGAATTLQLKAATEIDLNKQKNNISFDMKGDIFSLPINLNTVGNLDTSGGWDIHTNSKLELKFVDYQTEINFKEEENDLKDVNSFQSMGSYYNKKKAAIEDCFLKILQ
ncbi:hypothetical protein [Anaerocolumna sp. MB42-C2]|uniref:hypothetical protein n=1 Tax=Anaerocolumna sp. MB42-C2 TaxID=3070997 RepID=UPI0027E1BD19|nr:hypothetical protein [Anaerocolumna sp. MB42-C2]WMJ89957.1 hypothetical protein RBU59_10655 [Anaerocolumna sp. MB42-C2]